MFHRGVQVAVLTRVLKLLPLQSLKSKYSLIVFNNKLLRTNNNLLIVRARLLHAEFLRGQDEGFSSRCLPRSSGVC